MRSHPSIERFTAKAIHAPTASRRILGQTVRSLKADAAQHGHQPELAAEHAKKTFGRFHRSA